MQIGDQEYNIKLNRDINIMSVSAWTHGHMTAWTNTTTRSTDVLFTYNKPENLMKNLL